MQNVSEQPNEDLISAVATAWLSQSPQAVLSTPVSPRFYLPEHRSDRLEDIPPSIIHDEARICNWSSVLRLCQSHPHLAAYTSPRECQTALHHLCDRRCPIPSVFEALIRAFPLALTLTDTKGWTPLHCACRFKAPLEAVQLLLHSFPEYGRISAQLKCRVMGRIPLFYAIRYEAPSGVVELLLDYIYSVEDILEKDKVGISILGLTWDLWATREGKHTVSPFIHQYDRMLQLISTCSSQAGDGNVLQVLSSDDHVFLEPKQSDALRLQLDKVQMILQGAFHHRPGKSKWRLVHACSAINCHPSLFMVACVLYPEQAREIDQNDLYQQELMDDTQVFNRQTALHFATKAHSQGMESQKVLTTLLALYPEAAGFQNPSDCCYPLHYICNNESKVHWIHDGFRDVYDAYKDAIYQGNSLNQLPLHIAASVARYRPSPVLATNQPWTEDMQHPLQHPNIDAAGSIIQNLIDAYPESSRKQDNLGMLPFHYIAQTSDYWTMDVEILYLSFPEVIQTCTLSNGNLPLHFAANNNARADFIHALVKLYPSGCAIANHEGKLPLHLACETGKRWVENGVEAIYEAHTSAIGTIVSGTGRLPIHYAATCKTNTKELLAELIKRNNESGLVKDSRGKTPLLLAIESGKLWDDGLHVLLDASPDSIDVTDDYGNVPFILAALYSSKSCPDDAPSTLQTLFQLLLRAPNVLNNYRIV